jgi:hypothetical protein
MQALLAKCMTKKTATVIATTKTKDITSVEILCRKSKISYSMILLRLDLMSMCIPGFCTILVIIHCTLLIR